MEHLQPSILRVLNAVTSDPDGEHTLDIRRKLGAQFPGIRVKFVRTALIRLWKRGLVKWDGREHWRLSRKGTQLCVYGLAAAYHSGGYVSNIAHAAASIIPTDYMLPRRELQRVSDLDKRASMGPVTIVVTIDPAAVQTVASMHKRMTEIQNDIKRAFLVPGHMLGKDKS